MASSFVWPSVRAIKQDYFEIEASENFASVLEKRLGSEVIASVLGANTLFHWMLQSACWKHMAVIKLCYKLADDLLCQ